MESDKSLFVETIKYCSPVSGIRVLVVDSDSTCLEIVSKMLRVLGYEVLTAKQGADALYMVQQKGNELHLVLMEAHLPDMEICDLIDKIRTISTLPFSIMSSDANESSIVRALERGATRYIVKPIMLSDLGGLWQFATWSKSKERRISSKLAVTGLERHQSDEGAKRKKQPEEVVRKNEEGKAIEGPLVFKRKRLTWTKELQQRFMDAVNTIGVEKARPKKILQLMNVPGLQKEKVSSYLQKYRLSLKRQARKQKNNITNSSQSSLGSDSYHQHQTNYLQKSYLPTSKLQSLAYNPNTIYRNYNYLTNPTSMYFPAPALFPSQEYSLGHYSKQQQNQMILPWFGATQDYFRRRSLQSVNQQQYLTYKTNFSRNYQKGLSNFMSCQGTSSGYNQSISRQNELISPWNLQGAASANSTPNLTNGSNILGGGNNYADAGQVKNVGGIFNGNVFASHVGNSMHSMQQHFPQQPLPSEDKGHENSEVVVGRIDKSLGIENLQFNDDDE